MRILFCNFGYAPTGGDSGHANALLARELAARHDVTVVTSSVPGLPRDDTDGRVRVVRAPVFFHSRRNTRSLPAQLVYLPMAVAAGKRLLETESFDIIITHLAMPSGPVGDTLSRFSDTPHVLAVYNGDFTEAGQHSTAHRFAPLKAWVRRLAQRADRVVCATDATASRLHELYGTDISYDLIPLAMDQPDAAARHFEALFDQVVENRSAP